MITTHVLDLEMGSPARGVPVLLEIRRDDDWSTVGSGATGENGRLTTLTEGLQPSAGTYRLTFDVAAYHRRRGRTDAFFPSVTVIFTVHNAAEHFHVPLLISAFGYTIYRGS